MKLLLVEDDPLLRDLIQSDLLALFAYGEVEIVGSVDNFADAVKSLQRDSPDIALLDIELGEDRTAGIRIAHHINLTRPIPIVFLSALPRNQGFDVAKLTAPFAFLTKPYKRQNLTDTLELLLVRESRRNMALVDVPSKNERVISPSTSIIVTTKCGEKSVLRFAELVVLKADGKYVKAYLSDQVIPIHFDAGGLKNFFEEHQEVLYDNFFQLSRSYVICLNKVVKIKDNHVILPRFVSGEDEPFFRLPIPANSGIKKILLARLGWKE